ncbi:hypothetical protein PR202_ga21462 [Eleusine coracana subsp. coracana]|uniref:DUF632 domain-containing protein n=1 Tax=Eleusine coracana subsp. coracana TaxID=191504 RepID=A0AAV5CZ72_ELECO|nr:hypothetical protein PR202_ga21462 [Eleusine coracana subsp. coracana]
MQATPPGEGVVYAGDASANEGGGIGGGRRIGNKGSRGGGAHGTDEEAESRSDRIQKLRMRNYNHKLVELLQGLTKSWKIMADSHETQRQIMFEVNSFTRPGYGISSIAPDRAGAPTLAFLCHDWYTTLSKFSNKWVAFTMRNFIRSVRVLWLKQGEEQQQKRKVDIFAKEMGKKFTAYKRVENKAIETKLPDFRPDAMRCMDHLSIRRKRVEARKAKHHSYMRDTHDGTHSLNRFKIGLASIFESLTAVSSERMQTNYMKPPTQDSAKDSKEATEKWPGVEGPYSQIAVDAT